MRKALVGTTIGAAVVLLTVYYFLKWWHPPQMPAISSPIKVTVYRDCRPCYRTTLTTADAEYSMLVEWMANQNVSQFSARRYVTYLPDVVVDCDECEINFRHNNVVLSVKDDPRAWSQYEKTISEDDLCLRNKIILRASDPKNLAIPKTTDASAPASELPSPPSDAEPSK